MIPVRMELMYTVVGLGNPGEDYEKTRHNAGFLFVEKLAGSKSWNQSKSGMLAYVWSKIGDEEVELLKPLQFMNKSGEAVKYAVSKHPELTMDNLVVVFDDLDLKLGEYKLVQGKGPKQHNGVLSIYDNLGTQDFWHLRLGVENRQPDQPIPGEKYVLGKFTPEEKEFFDQVLEKAVVELKQKIASS